MATPFATRGSGDFIVRDGDTVSGDSATGGAGGNVTLEGGDATAATNTDGGDVVLRPGLEDGTGSIGEVQVTNRTGTEDDAIIAFSSATGNSHTIRWRTGTVQPNTDLVPASAGGDLYVQSDGTMWIASASGTGNWSQFTAGGGGNTLQQAYVAGNTIVTDTTNGDFDVSGTEAISLDASVASNFSVAGANLTVESAGSSGSTQFLNLTSTNAGAGGARMAISADDVVGITTGDFDVDVTASVSIDADAASNFTVDGGGDLTLNTATLTTTTNAGGVVITGGNNTNVTSGDGGSITLTPGNSTAGSDGSLIFDYATWPAADGTSGQVLSTNGGGVLSWATAGGGGSSDAGQTGVQYEGLLFYVDAGNRTSYGGSGTTWTDLIAQTAGTMTAVTVTDGYLNFDGTTSVVNFGTLSAANEDLFDGGGTVCVWVRAETDGGGTLSRIVTTEGATSGGWLLGASGGGTAAYDISFEQRFTTSNGFWSFTASVVPLNEWVHVAVSYDNGADSNDPTIYLNGVAQTLEENSVPSGTRESDSGETLYIGNNAGQTRTFDGDINGVYFYDQAFTEAEVLRHYNATNKYLRPDLIGHLSSANSGESLVIRGGETTSTAASASGGDVTIQGGTSGSTAVSGTAHGGDVFILGGTTNSGGSGIATGGDVTIQAATPESDGAGGSVLIASGSGGSGGGSTDAGDITLTAGDRGGGQGQGGAITLTAGLSDGAIVTGGPITITGGENEGPSGQGGLVTITGGEGVRSGGDITIKGGTKNTGFAGGANRSGAVTIEAGDITGTNGFGFGDITIRVPSPASPSTSNVVRGNITIEAGDNGTNNNEGGNVTITAGDTYGFNTRIGGSIFLNCGNENNGVSTSEGGSVIATPGTSVAGHDGRLKIQGTGTLEMVERASAIGIVGGVGYFWVRSDTPNVPMFTNDAGTDFVLNTSGGGGELGAAVEDTGSTNPATMDASFAWRITDSQTLTFETAAASNEDLLVLAPAAGGDTVTVGHGASDTFVVSASTFDVNASTNDFSAFATFHSSTASTAVVVGDNAASGTGVHATGGALVLDSQNSGSNVQIATANTATTPGNIQATAGNATGATADDGGDITLTGGSSTNAGGSGDGGTISLQPGTATGSGSDGSLILDYSTWPAAEGTSGQVLSTNGSGTLSWADAGGGSAWSEETNSTTDATAGVTIATPIATVTDGTQHSVEVLITAEAGGANTYFRRQIFTFYRNGGGAVQWTTEINGTEARRGLTTATASLSVSSNSVLVTATGEAATTINWKVQYRTTNTITNGGTVSTTGIVRETFDNRGSATTTGSATASGGTVDFTIAAGASYVSLQFLRVTTATGTCNDATIQFFRDAARTDEIYDAENKDTGTGNGWVDRNVAAMLGDDGSGLASNTMYGRITNNDAGAATFDVEAVLWGVT